MINAYESSVFHCELLKIMNDLHDHYSRGMNVNFEKPNCDNQRNVQFYNGREWVVMPKIVSDGLCSHKYPDEYHDTKINYGNWKTCNMDCIVKIIYSSGMITFKGNEYRFKLYDEQVVMYKSHHSWGTVTVPTTKSESAKIITAMLSNKFITICHTLHGYNIDHTFDPETKTLSNMTPHGKFVQYVTVV